MMKSILEKLDFLNSQIFFIPGNHDPFTLFQKNENNYQFTPKSINLHKSQYYIQKDLRIIGLGGSVPAIKNSKEYWVGYPYLTDNLYEEDLQELNKYFSKEEKVQTILLSHVGPFSSQTSNDLEEGDGTIFAGSKALDNFLFKQIQTGQILCNVHGHTHNGRGMNKIHGIQILNPGPFKAGNFVIMKLMKEEILDLWQIYKQEFINLLNSKI
eukprot:TRINITY_DN5778_c0_g1_i8.p1 TRINITY_DN5778_c0_g1~~TRINITY_DN5778_c0_g1_i8.p1  ORF type:complete len:212 (+),score=19.76 TRINITY_DN5778_c0_g1_i8:261-896(+)